MVNVTKSTLIAGSQSTGGRSCKCMYKPEPPDFQVLGWGGGGGTGYLFIHY